jgi:hypothetical protein
MENLQNAIPLLSKTRKNNYLCGMEKGKEINWLFPDVNTEVSIEDYRKKIFEDEHSGDMSFKEFKEKLEAWWGDLN